MPRSHLATRARAALSFRCPCFSSCWPMLAMGPGKLTTIPLLLKTSPAALAAYLCGSMALYLFYKLARRDFQYWVPTAGAGVSLLLRVPAKLFRVGDFCGNPQLRHQFEMGGTAHLFMLSETQGTLPVAASTVAYSRLYASNDEIDDALLFTALAVSWAHGPSLWARSC